MMRPMSARDFSTVGVIGLGTMGAGIAEVFARNGYQVVGVEQTEETLKRGRQHVEHSTGRAVKRGKLTEEQQEELVGRITFTTSMADVKDCGLVVEAVVEQLPVKQQIFRALDDIVGPDAVLATNTSSLSVTEISTATSHPGRVIGVHFFNPAPVQALVEIIRTVVTEHQGPLAGRRVVRGREDECLSLPKGEFVLVLALLGLPLVTLLMGRFVTGNFVARYSIEAMAGLAVVLTYSIGTLFLDRREPALLAALLMVGALALSQIRHSGAIGSTTQQIPAQALASGAPIAVSHPSTNPSTTNSTRPTIEIVVYWRLR